MIKNIKATVFIYILLLINIWFIISVVVFNNTYVLENNINIWKNNQELFSSIYDKWNVSIETVKKYNTNWEWVMNAISCPTNVTMSWTVSTWSTILTNITTTLVYDYWNFYCLGDYNWKEFRVYYKEDYWDFKNAYYEWDVVDIIRPVTQYVDMTTNLALLASVTATDLNTDKWISIASIKDGITSTWTDALKHAYYSIKDTDPYITLDLASTYKVWLVRIYNSAYSSKERKKLNWSKIELYDNSSVKVKQTSIWSADELIVDKNFDYSAAVTNPIKKVKLTKYWNNKDIALREIEIYEWKYWAWDLWTSSGTFSDFDLTMMTFDSSWIWWVDLFDDNFNSDDYVIWSWISSTWSIIYYPNWFSDDDAVPRKTIFWSIAAKEENMNIFWNNYLTNNFISNNTNNDDIYNVKIWDVTNGYMYLDLYNTSWSNLFDMKLVVFDRSQYQNNNSLLPISSIKWVWISGTVWYIQNNSSNLSLSKTITWNEYVFDFKNNDYAIFLSNNTDGNLVYKLSSETNTWTWIYINSIDDSGTWVISVMSNHIVIWIDNNYIWENIEIIWSK